MKFHDGDTERNRQFGIAGQDFQQEEDIYQAKGVCLDNNKKNRQHPLVGGLGENWMKKFIFAVEEMKPGKRSFGVR